MRALRLRKAAVTLVSDLSKANLAQAELGVRAVSGEHGRFTQLWVTGAAEAGRIVPVGGVSRVISFLSVQGKDRTWVNNAHTMFPGAQIDVIDAHLTRPLAIDLARREAGDQPPEHFLFPPPRTLPPEAPLLLHLGAGSRVKRWSLAAWVQLIELLRQQHPSVPLRIVAGEVEAEQYSQEQHAAFDRLGGEFLGELSALRNTVAAARLVVVADSGPAHLAGQLGVPVIALFGPTVPDLWAPIGPVVHTVAPATPSAMDWLAVASVADAIELELRRSSGGGQPARQP
jgi:ADP-heptose:LPS heptosyltransferase